MLATWGTSTGFNPASLFSGGVQGAWYDPSDNTTMFQDAAGTTPVTAVEQAVGLILDKSKGLVLGPELMTNGGPSFVNTTGWSTTGSATVSIVGGNLRITRGATAGVQTATIQYTGAVIGGGYFMTVAMAANSANINTTVQSYGNTTLANSATVGGSPTRTIFYNADRTNPFLIFRLETGSSGDYVDISLASVKAIAGNHAYQTTSASRPTLRARYNLLTYSEEFDNAAWSKINLVTSGWVDVAVAPDGTITADRMIENTTASVNHYIGGTVSVVSGTTYTLSFYAKTNGRNIVAEFAASGFGSNKQATFNLTAGTTSSLAGVTSSITNAGNGWYRCTATCSATATVSTAFYFILDNGGNQVYTGDGTSGIFIWGAQLTAPSVFPSNTYQRIAAATDYATGAAFPQYLAFDGTDDSLLTANVDFATVTSDGQARRNLLLNPTQFDAAGWTTQNATVTANNATAPDNTTTAELVTATGTSPTATVISSAVTVTPSTTYTYSVYLKAGTATTVRLRLSDVTTGQAQADINLSTGATSIFAAGPYGSPSVSAVSVGSGWWRVSLTGTQPAGQTSAACGIYLLNNGETTLIWGAQLEIGSTATAFQNIGTDKMTVWSGLSKLSDATTAAAVELSASSTSNNGTFAIFAPNTAADYGWRSRGTISVTLVPSGYASPRTNVVTGIGDLAAPLTQIRINGAIATTDSSTSPGTGNYLSYPLYIGRRGGTTLPFNGRIYSLIVRGAASNSTQIEQTERYVASKTPLGVVP